MSGSSLLPHASPLDLPEELESLRLEAKRLAHAGKFAGAREQNLALHARSRELGSALGEVLGLRFAGLCEYRLDEFKASERSLRSALDLALEGGFRTQELFISNHLGATLRRLGRLDEAYRTFQENLAKTRLPHDLEARARLLGNLGALLDEIGDVRAADDCYARYEELVELLVRLGDGDDVARLANARALAARAAFRRGDLVTAKVKHDDEQKLARECGDAVKKLAAVLHQAKIEHELGRSAQGEARERHFENARRLFEDAAVQAREQGQMGRVADVAYHRGRLFEAEEEWAEAHGKFVESLKTSRDLGDWARQAKVCHALALICQTWALHGEALWYWREAAKLRNRIYRPLMENASIGGMAQTRLAELSDLARSLVDESRRVERSEEELADLKKLVEDITGRPFVKAPSGVEDVWKWQRDIREASRKRWSDLLKGAYERLGKQSKADLVMADVSYHGAIDDLPRSALLLAVVVERELRDRLLVPLYKRYWSAFPSGPKPTGRSLTSKYLAADDPEYVPLGKILPIVVDLCAEGPVDPRDDGLEFAREQARSFGDALKKIARLAPESIQPLGDRPPVRLLDLRNEVAHGKALLDRLSVDALKRTLVLEAPVILQSLVEIDLRPR